MSGRFAGKTIIVTGTGSGIGRATARLFAEAGAQVLACDVSEEVEETSTGSATLAKPLSEERPSMIETHIHGNVLEIVMVNPPVNALGVDVRKGLFEAITGAQDDPAIAAIVMRGSGNLFSGGADITEFGKPPVDPWLPKLHHPARDPTRRSGCARSTPWSMRAR